jgi:hypothetical protein
METRKSYGQAAEFDQHEMFFRLINPDEYPRHGINPEDVPIGTFAAEDHPGYLPSRFGGNAYGLGLFEQEVLNKADTDFLESIDFENLKDLQEHSRKLNAIYQKLGLLIRFSTSGKRYFLIPINLVAHSFQEIKIKADEAEALIKRHMSQTRSERFDIGLVTSAEDLITHELTARFSNQRIHQFDSLDKLRSWHIPLDIVILPNDPFHFLLEQHFPQQPAKKVRKRELNNFASYLAAKLFDLLDKDGRLYILAHAAALHEESSCRVRFKTEDELKWFLLFSHTFKTEGKYSAPRAGNEMEIHLSDLHYYLNRFVFSEPRLRRLLNRQRPEDLSPEEIDRLPYLNIASRQFPKKDLEKEWRRVFEPFFHIESLQRESSQAYEKYWGERIEVDIKLPESLQVMVAVRRQPTIALSVLEDEVRGSGMQGCALPLVAEYRKTFRFVLEVLKELARIRNRAIDNLSELELNRLSNPFHNKSKGFPIILQLLEKVPKLEKIQAILNLHSSEGQEISIIDNLEKLSLLGFSPEELREILLIVVGHTTMTRIVFGKIPAKTLKSITDRSREEDHHELLDLLRVCRLMSMAEILAALGDAFMGEQAAELFRLYDEAVQITMDSEMDWDRLEDLRISTLGGVQNRAIREMMKFFNLFDFLNTWQEYLNKGQLQKEVICDYDSGRLARMEDALQLARVAEEFKQKFLGDYIFGQSYFFRQFLETEFHGTGPVFRQLGTRAGFILLWIAVNSSDKNILNFNPILAGISAKDHRTRLNKLRQALLGIPIDRLHPNFFEDIKANFAEHRAAFIFDSGIRLILDHETRVLDISFVDVEENIRKIQDLLAVFESRKLSNISLRDLHEMERRFSEMMSFHKYLDREGCNLQCSVFDSLGGVEQKSREILEIEDRLRLILQSQIFIPEEIYDNISVLHNHCREILGFIIPELRGLGFLGGISPEPGSGSLEDYVMRCLEKYQALVNKDRNSFQDRNTFYRLAKQEFGPLAEEGLGATHPQIETLEFYMDRIREKPQLQQALTFAQLFQEIGKLEIFSGSGMENYWTHGRQGAEILKKMDILKRYHLDPRVEDTTIFLVRYHGLLGHVIKGEEPIPALERITGEKDTQLLDAFLLQSVLAASAVKEGIMVSDFLDGFIHYRGIALEVIKSGTSWENYLKEFLEEKGRAALHGFEFKARDEQSVPDEHANYCGIQDSDIRNENLWQGRQSAALDRLLKLAGSLWVDYEDLQMHMLDIPINFIYHKKKLKSVGPATFEKQLLNGIELLRLLSSLRPEVRYYLLHCLDHLGGAMRVYDFSKLPDYLGLAESLKLLFLSFQALHHYFGIARKGGLISFANLSRQLDKRWEIVKGALEKAPFPERCFEGEHAIFTPDQYGELRFQASAQERAINISYQDTMRFDSMIQTLFATWDIDELKKTYENYETQIKRRMPKGAEDFEEELERAFGQQQKKINERVLKEFQGKLARVWSFSDFEKVRQEIIATGAKFTFAEEQKYLLDEISEFNRSRLRDNFLDTIYHEINTLSSKESLLKFWNEMRHELFMYRSYIGKEYETLIAKFIDEKLARAEDV